MVGRLVPAEPAVALVEVVLLVYPEAVGRVLLLRLILHASPIGRELRVDGVRERHVGAGRGGDDVILIVALPLAGDADAGDRLLMGIVGREAQGDEMVVDRLPFHARLGVLSARLETVLAGVVLLHEAHVVDGPALALEIEGHPPELVGVIPHVEVLVGRGVEHLADLRLVRPLGVEHQRAVDSLLAVRPGEDALPGGIPVIVLAGTHHEVGHDQLRFLLQLRMLLHVGVQVLLQRIFPRGVLRQVIERDHEAVGGIALRPVAHEVEVAVHVGDGVVPALEVHGGVSAGDDHDALLGHMLVQLRLRISSPSADLSAVRTHHAVVGLEPVLVLSRRRGRLGGKLRLGGEHRLVVIHVLLPAIDIGIAPAEDTAHQHVGAVGVV